MGMQGLSAKSLKGLAGFRRKQGGLGPESGGVGVIAQQRMADMGEVHPDLVGPAGFQAAHGQAGDRLAVDAGVFLQDLPVGYGLAAALPDRLLVARLGMAI